MPDDPQVHLQRVNFGLAPVGSTLSFSIASGSGFAVRAVLDCDAKVVASWEFEELKDGDTKEEVLIPKGTYTLTLHIAFTGTKDAPVNMTFSVGSKTKTRTMTGTKPDIGRALAVVFIQ